MSALPLPMAVFLEVQPCAPWVLQKQDDLYPGQHGDHSSHHHHGEAFFRSAHSEDVEGAEGSGVGSRLLGGGSAGGRQLCFRTA